MPGLIFVDISGKFIEIKECMSVGSPKKNSEGITGFSLKKSRILEFLVVLFQDLPEFTQEKSQKQFGRFIERLSSNY